MKNKILLSTIFCFTLFLAAFLLNEVSAATKNHKYMSITMPSAYENDDAFIGTEDDEFAYRTYYRNDCLSGISFHYHYGAGLTVNNEYASSDVTPFAADIENRDYESDTVIDKYTILSKGLIYIDGVAAIKIRYEVKKYYKNANETYYYYYENYYVATDHVNYEFYVYLDQNNKSYLDSQEYKNMINSIVIKDTVSNSRITPFKDVKTSAWYYNAVKYNWQNNIVNGTNAYTFAPNSKVTRAMVVTMLYSMAGAPAVTAANKFTDVSSSKYYYNAVRWAAANKIVSGYAGTSKFGPNDYVTREQLAVMLTNFATYKNKYKAATSTSLSSFSDASKVASWATNSVKWAVKNNIINGTNGKLNPKGNATRAEVATMLYSYNLNIK